VYSLNIVLSKIIKLLILKWEGLYIFHEAQSSIIEASLFYNWNYDHECFVYKKYLFYAPYL
jgi:hypothetical protein